MENKQFTNILSIRFDNAVKDDKSQFHSVLYPSILPTFYKVKIVDTYRGERRKCYSLITDKIV
jgi:hypothetical protein